MAQYECSVCGFVHDESKDGVWDSLPDDWTCPVCGAGKSQFESVGGEPPPAVERETPDQPLDAASEDEYLGPWKRASDELETHMADIHAMAATGRSIIEPMRTKKKTF